MLKDCCINNFIKINNNNIYINNTNLIIDKDIIQNLFKQLPNISSKNIIFFLNKNIKNILTKSKFNMHCIQSHNIESLKFLINIKHIKSTDILNNKTKIYWCTLKSPIGHILIATMYDRLCSISFINDKLEYSLKKLQQKWPMASLYFDCKKTKIFKSALESYFKGNIQRTTIPIIVNATSFQYMVWQALLNIPAGHILTYGDVADLIMNKKAYRAVGCAIRQNPINCFIPCHRVINANGALGGYSGGIERKLILLALEQCKFNILATRSIL